MANVNDDLETTLHYGGFLGEQVVVSASLFAAVMAHSPRTPAYQLRYMATDFDAQGNGFGARVMSEARRALREVGAQELWANARDSALGFYQATGWTHIEGSEHLSPETQLPHTVIVLRLEES